MYYIQLPILMSYFVVQYTERHYPTPKQIYNFLKPETSGIAVQWYNLGLELLDDEGGPGILDAIKADNPNDVNICCKKMFIKWLLMKPYASWSQLVIALKRIGMNTAAMDLSNQLRRGNNTYFTVFSF